MADKRDHLGEFVVARMVRIGVDGPVLTRSEATLRPEDRERAGRFRFPEDRARFLLGRRLLAKLLAVYAGYPDASPELALTEKGRPFLPQDPEVHFSITHSHELVAVALSLRCQVGIDIERISHHIKMADLAARIFSDHDLKRFQALPPTEASRAFFHAWTGKEARLKAQGVGLFGGLKEVSVPFPGESGQSSGGDWCLECPPIPTDYIGHVAWNDHRRKLDFQEMNLENLA